MEPVAGIDWRDARAYAQLHAADRSLFAWEWLRRDVRYRAAAAAAHGGTGADARAAAFGLVAFEPPQRAVPAARPLWTSAVNPQVLAVCAGRGRNAGDRFDAARLGGLVTLVAGAACDHLLLSDGLRALRLDAPAGTFTAGPAALRYLIEGIVAAEPPLRTLRRFLALCRTGGFACSLHRAERRAQRWILILRARDAIAAGAPQREIADVLLSRRASGPHWRSSDPSLRAQAQRLVRAARCFAAGSYLTLLS